MALRRPRLKLQPNVVTRPPARDTAPVPAEGAVTSPVAEAAGDKPRPQLPSRFKRLAPRLKISRPSAATARRGGSTTAPPDGSTAADAATAAATAAADDHDDGGAAGQLTAPDPPDSLQKSPPAEVAPASKRVRLSSCGGEAAVAADSSAGSEPPQPQTQSQSLEPAPVQPMSLVAIKRRQPEPPAEEQTELEAAESGAGLSEVDLYLRKRFKVPVRTKSNHREMLEQITERVCDNMPIRSKMTMQDLIYWNPSTEAMSNSVTRQPKERKSRLRRDSVSSSVSVVAESFPDDPLDVCDEPASQPEPPGEEPEEEPMPVPQLKVAADGSIIIDEQSLVVKTNQQRQRDQEMGTEVMCDVNGSRLSFNGYRQRRHINEWSIKETARFYKALSTVGTDFSIMKQLFPNRTRVDLKKKFKKEERCNAHLVERALRQDMQYDLAIFDDDVWETSVEKCKTVKQQIREEKRQAKRDARAKDIAARQIERSERRKSRPKIQAKVEKIELDKAAAEEILSSIGEVSSPKSPEFITPECESTADLTAVTGTPVMDGAVAPMPAAGMPPGVLQLPGGVNPQNLLIIASPSADRPDGQVLHVYMIQPAPGQQGADINVTIPHALPPPPDVDQYGSDETDQCGTGSAGDGAETKADCQTPMVEQKPVSLVGAGDEEVQKTGSADNGGSGGDTECGGEAGAPDTVSDVRQCSEMGDDNSVESS